MASLRMGLIGCGRIAELVHLDNLTRMPGVELVAIADPDAERRAAAKTRAPGAVELADDQELLQRDDVDAVVICLPAGLQAEVATRAFEAGKHVYLEKPMATSLEGARAACDAWRRSGRIGMMGYQNRFHPLYQSARELLQAGGIGRLVGARAVLCAPARNLPTWKQRRKDGGGVLLGLATHHADLAYYLFDRVVREVSATVWSVKSEEDNATLEMRLSDGLVLQLFVSMSAVRENRVDVYGDEGKLAVDRHSAGLVHTPTERGHRLRDRLAAGTRGLLWQAPRDFWNSVKPPVEPSYRLALGSFVAAVAGERPVAVDLDDGYRALSVILAAEEAARTRRVVAVEEDPARR